MREKIEEKITQCGEALADLQKYRSQGDIEYLRVHPEIYFSVCFRFITAIEALFDLGQYELINRKKRATSEREIPLLLAKYNVIPDDLASRFGSMYGFRNRLVHAYGTLDDTKVADYLARHLTDIEELLTIFRKLST